VEPVRSVPAEQLDSYPMGGQARFVLEFFVPHEVEVAGSVDRDVGLRPPVGEPSLGGATRGPKVRPPAADE